MCGIVGVIAHTPVNQLIYDSLCLLQHRGQDAAGIATCNGSTFNIFKGNGMVRDVFRTRNMRTLQGNSGIGHVRYPTSGSCSSEEEAQPFYVNAPFGITFATNGNLTNADELREALFRVNRRHINTSSDSEVLLNILAHGLETHVKGLVPMPHEIFEAVAQVHERVRGAYAVIAQIADYGMLVFRDPYGIRPLCMGKRETEQGTEWMFSSESVTMNGTGFELVRDVAPGEAIFVDQKGQLHSHLCAPHAHLNPCLFEYVYFARSDSIIDGINVYNARLKMGEYLADKVARSLRLSEIDVVMPIPDTSRPSAMQLAAKLKLTYREGFIKNRYVGRTFIMPGQAVRKKTVRQKLNALGMEFEGKNVLLVDDSIVRGTTSREIVEMARDAGAKKVFFASAAPEVRFPNVYGIDMPTSQELIAYQRTPAEIAKEIGADGLIYQDLNELKQLLRELNPAIHNFESSCFDGQYITGDVDDAYLERLSQQRES